MVDTDLPKQNQGILLKTVRIDVRPVKVKENFASPYLGVFPRNFEHRQTEVQIQVVIYFLS